MATKFSVGTKVVLHSTSDARLDGQKGVVMGKTAGAYIVFFDSKVDGYDPAIGIVSACLREA